MKKYESTQIKHVESGKSVGQYNFFSNEPQNWLESRVKIQNAEGLLYKKTLNLI
jgi:hypothetical protein